ncbi:MAG: methyltransferase [Anaerolineae bacterium]|nr:methyltransferase [Anaerolineae bacterium]
MVWIACPVRYATCAAFADRPNVHICEGDITTRDTVAQLAGHRLDTVMCLNVLEHIEDHQTALRHMAELLTPGGRCSLRPGRRVHARHPGQRAGAFPAAMTAANCAAW